MSKNAKARALSTADFRAKVLNSAEARNMLHHAKGTIDGVCRAYEQADDDRKLIMAEACHKVADRDVSKKVGQIADSMRTGRPTCDYDGLIYDKDAGIGKKQDAALACYAGFLLTADGDATRKAAVAHAKGMKRYAGGADRQMNVSREALRWVGLLTDSGQKNSAAEFASDEARAIIARFIPAVPGSAE